MNTGRKGVVEELATRMFAKFWGYITHAFIPIRTLTNRIAKPKKIPGDTGHRQTVSLGRPSRRWFRYLRSLSWLSGTFWLWVEIRMVDWSTMFLRTSKRLHLGVAIIRRRSLGRTRWLEASWWWNSVVGLSIYRYRASSYTSQLRPYLDKLL